MSVLRASSPEKSHTVKIFDSRITITVSGEETGGTWSQIDYLAPPKWPGAPLHKHGVSTEQFLIMEGELTLYAGEQQLTIKRGESAIIPPGLVHRFANEADAPCRFIATLVPAGIEAYFPKLAQLVQRAGGWPPTDPAILDELSKITAEHDIYGPE